MLLFQHKKTAFNMNNFQTIMKINAILTMTMVVVSAHDYMWEELPNTGGTMPLTDSGSHTDVALTTNGNLFSGRPEGSEQADTGFVNIWKGYNSYRFEDNLKSDSTAAKFGTSVDAHYYTPRDTKGDTIVVVGDPNAQVEGISNAGRATAYIQKRDSNVFTIEGHLQALVPTAGSGFGHAVSVIDAPLDVNAIVQIVAVGAPTEISSGNTTGAVYLQSYADDSWLIMSGGVRLGAGDGDEFGYSVSGDTGIVTDVSNIQFSTHVAVGAPGGDYVKFFRLQDPEAVPLTWEPFQSDLVKGTGLERCGQSVSVSDYFVAVACSSTVRVYDLLQGIQIGSDLAVPENSSTEVSLLCPSGYILGDCTLIVGDAKIHSARFVDGDWLTVADDLEVNNAEFSLEINQVQSGQSLSTQLVVGQSEELRVFLLAKKRDPTAAPTAAPTTLAPTPLPTMSASFQVASIHYAAFLFATGSFISLLLL